MAKDFWKNTKVSVRMHIGKPNEMLLKFQMKYISESTVPSFTYFPENARDVSDEHGERFL